MQERTQGKIEAIYDLRDAVERKVRAEVELERRNGTDARSEFLDASIDVEQKTQDAIDVCHVCDRAHSSDEPHERRSKIGAHFGNVVRVTFGRSDAR